MLNGVAVKPVLKTRVRLARTLVFLCLLTVLTLPAQAFHVPDPLERQALRDAIARSDSFADQYDAQVWLVGMSARLARFMKNEKERLHLLTLVHREAQRAGLQPELVLAVIHVESAFERYAISRVGALGYMQVMPFWKNEIGDPEDNLMHPETNLRYGCTILKHYLDREKGDLIRALARYNGSLGRTKYPEKVLLAWERHWFMQY